MNQSNTTTPISLQEEDFYVFKKLGIPTTALLIPICIIGTFGNLHVLLVYFLRYKTSVYKTFVLYLTAVDLLGCVFCIPSSLYLIRYPISMSSVFFCKFFYACAQLVGLYSLSLLTIISVERYRKVCQVTRPQITPRTARLVCAAAFVLAFLLSVMPSTVLYGINRVPTLVHGLPGYECDILNDLKESTLRKLSSIVALIIILTCIVAVVLYCLIGRQIYIHMKIYKTDLTEGPTTMSRMTFPNSRHTGQAIGLADRSEGSKNSSQVVEFTNESAVQESSDIDTEENICIMTRSRAKYVSRGSSDQSDNGSVSLSSGHSYSIREIRKRKGEKLKKIRNITRVFSVVTIISFAGYLPFLVMQSIGRQRFEDFKQKNGALHLFLKKMLYLNNAVNPVMYGFLDAKFRYELSCMYNQLKLLCSRKQ